LNRGANYYSEGRYIDAAQLFEHTESALASYDPAERARYGLYRGATLLRLGDVAEAQRWLSYAAQMAARNRHALTASEAVSLREALSEAKPRHAALRGSDPQAPVALPEVSAEPRESNGGPALRPATTF
jgi:tetratricopeptide (TPR) repeat protein